MGRAREVFSVLLLLCVCQGVQIALLGYDDFWNSDAQQFFLPAFQELKRQFAEGRWPLLTYRSWLCSNLVGEYQLGLTGLWTPLCAWLCLTLFENPPHQALFFMQVQFFVSNSGFYALARSYGVAPRHAAAASICHAFAGWNLLYAGNWWNCFIAYAWIPWSLACLQFYLAGGKKRWLLGLFVSAYTSITSGYPFATLWLGLALIQAWLSGVGAGRERLLRSAGIAVALAVAFVPTLGALSSVYESSMRRFPDFLQQFKMTVTGYGYLGVLNSALLSQYSDEPGYHNGLEQLGMLLPLLAVLVALASPEWGRLLSYRGLWCCFGLTLLLTLFPSPPPLRWSHRWLPYLQLLLCLLGALALPERAEQAGAVEKRMLALGSALSLAVWAWWPVPAALQQLPGSGRSAGFAAVAACAGAALIGWLAGRRRPGTALIGAALTLPVLTLAWVPNPLDRLNFSGDPGLKRPAPLETDRRYLCIASFKDRPGSDTRLARLGNTGMWADLETLNGYSPLAHSGLSRLLGLSPYGTLEERRTRQVCTVYSGPGDLLDFFGVDGLTLAPGEHWHYLSNLVGNGWQPVLSDPGGTVLHKPKAGQPAARSVTRVVRVASERDALLALVDHPAGAFVPTLEGGAGPTEFTEVPMSGVVFDETAIRAQVGPGQNPARPGLIVFLRPYWKGYRAFWNGRELPLQICCACLPAAVIPAGESGRLELVYRPAWLSWAPWCAALALLLTGLSVAGRPSRSGG